MLAAPAYLKKHGTPKQPQELSEHAWLALSLLPTPLTWKFSNSQGQSQTVHMKSRLQADAPSALMGLIEQGAGISTLEEMTALAAIKSGKLVQLLPDWSLPTGGVYAVLPPGRHVPARVRAFIDFYREFIGK